MKNSKKILMISQDYPPLVYGGIGRHVSELHEALVLNQVEVNIIAPKKEGHLCNENGVFRVSECGPKANSLENTLILSPIDFIQFNLSAISVGQSLNNVDLVHCHDIFSIHAGVTLAEFYNVPLVLTKHTIIDEIFDYKFFNLHRNLTVDELQLYNYCVDLQRWALKKADHIICVSHFLQNRIRAIDEIAFLKSSVLLNGCTFFEKYAKSTDFVEKRSLKESIKLLVVGRLHWKKGGDIAIKALSMISDKNVTLTFLGKGKFKNHLEFLARELHLTDRINFLEHKEEEELVHEYINADLVIIPSRDEPFGLVAAEALSLGKLVIASNVGGLKEQISHGVNGLLFHPEDAEDLAEKIKNAIFNHETVFKLRINAVIRSKTAYSWNRFVKKLIKQYQKLINRRRV